jgi:hypothetical protein
MTKREHVLEHGVVRLSRDRAKAPRLQPPAQHGAQPFGSIESLTQPIALPTGLRELGVETPSPGQPGYDVAKEESEPAHSRP